MIERADFYEVRRAVNRKPATYRCPFCNGLIPALTPHALVRPNGQGTGRRHAHMECVARARQAGQLPSREEWRAAQRGPSLWSRLRHRAPR